MLRKAVPEEFCLILLHSIIPYFYTYFHGGNFAWTEKVNEVDVQCPNPSVRVKVAVKIVDNKIAAVITSSTLECQAGMKAGRELDLSAIFTKICPLVYDIIFPWVQKGLKGEIKLRCQGCGENKGKAFIIKGDNL